MTPEEKIDLALKKIETLFVEQCEHGAQTHDLRTNGAACGQFVGSAAKDRPQRGLHGTAAALRVLAEGNSPESCGLVPKLLWYIQNRENLRQQGREGAGRNHNFDDDQQNVIKLSEVLYALYYVKASQGQTDSLKTELAQKLLAARKENKGWTHFLNANTPIDNLPTAFAILALTQHGYEQEIGNQIAFLSTNALEAAPNEPSSITEMSVRIFCLFALAFRAENLPQDDLKRLKRTFKELWKANEALFDQDLEQNIEYWNGPSNYYVRIPWQLYLLALAARLDPKRISSFAAQRRLNEILESVLDMGFRYAYSGSSLSSRTNAILFDVLQKIKRFSKRNLLHAIYHGIDCVRTLLINPFFAWMSLIVSVLAAGYCLFAWITKSGKPQDVGPDLSGAVIALLITFSLGWLRKPRYK